MPDNVELKARYTDHDRAKSILKEIGAGFDRIERQLDTYFRVPRGRLKLREIEDFPSELIFYERIENGGRRDCLYHLVESNDPAGLKSLLEACLGSWTRVSKTRNVYRFKNVKINLDEVEGLGNFIEFEAAADGDPESAELLIGELVEKFGIEPGDVELKSYSDLLGNR
jgi:adenylate cyclase class IV